MNQWADEPIGDREWREMALTGYRIGIDVAEPSPISSPSTSTGGSPPPSPPRRPGTSRSACSTGWNSSRVALGIDRPALLGATERIVHGTTVATNALLERKGAKLGLLTTEGHRDVLEMREGLKDDRTRCANRRRTPWSRATCACRCASASGRTAAWRRGSGATPCAPPFAPSRRRGSRR